MISSTVFDDLSNGIGLVAWSLGASRKEFGNYESSQSPLFKVYPPAERLLTSQKFISFTLPLISIATSKLVPGAICSPIFLPQTHQFSPIYGERCLHPLLLPTILIALNHWMSKSLPSPPVTSWAFSLLSIPEGTKLPLRAILLLVPGMRRNQPWGRQYTSAMKTSPPL